MKVEFYSFLAVAAMWAQNAPAQDSQLQPAPVVVELFTSQSCNSCVPASKLASELSAREGVIVLGWHVDYWNTLNTKHGRWVDPYSSAANTERQKKYNENIRRRRSVYTPQIVVAGDSEAAGSSREKIEALVETATTRVEPTAIRAVAEGSSVNFNIGRNPGGNAYLITFNKSVETSVHGGENAGLEFHDVNVVTDVKRLGTIRRIGATFTAPMPQSGFGCALILQTPGQGKILDAAYCPES